MPGSAENQVHIAVRDMTMAYGDFVIQKDLNFEVRRGDIFVIMGGSGCGKSTLLRHLIGLKPPAEGDVFYDGASFWQGSDADRDAMKRSFGVLFQSGALWSSMTLAENIGLPLRQYTRLSEAEIREVAAWKLALVGLTGFEDYYPNEISGGMKKRVGLARAMAMDPDILFFDEPSAGLDPISAEKFDRMTEELARSLGLTVFLVTHDLDTLHAICDRVAVLYEGKVAAIGTIPEITADAKGWVKEYFSGPRGRAAKAGAAGG